MPAATPSAEFPFESRFVAVEGAKMHYVDEGEGDVALFLHGNPTSCYLWRNVIPHMTAVARVVAVDLIGMGRSDKPDIPYRFFDHSRYLEGFIDKLRLENVTLVMHDWGSALGFHYARRHESNVRGLAFVEAILGPATWGQFRGSFRPMFKLFRAPFTGWLMIVALNMFLREVLPRTILRRLSAEETARYREPFTTWSSRRPVRQWPREIPVDGKPADVAAVAAAYRDWLRTSELPKLLLWADPGAVVTRRGVEWCEANLPNLDSVAIGRGLHFVQEDEPDAIGRALVDWYRRRLTPRRSAPLRTATADRAGGRPAPAAAEPATG